MKTKILADFQISISVLLKEIGIIQDLSKLKMFVNLWVSKFHSSLH